MAGSLRRVLVANRGEIAVRIIVACRKLGIESVLVVSDADRNGLATKMANKIVCIGPGPVQASYLKADTIIHAALANECDAVHPGYGFLAENASFARGCTNESLIFIGPSARSMELMGDKLTARALAIKQGVPVVSGSNEVATAEQALAYAKDLGFPILLKASGGGGGRGMRIVHSAAEIPTAFENASAEARIAFGNQTLYMERFIANARHVEVQIIADKHGNVIHLGERDCSIQRRHQKVVEESPSPVVDSSLYRRMADSAVRLAKHVGYESAGTLEFLLDQDTRDFFFLEMNTRIQVEHPVTEMVTGFDLVTEQLRIAEGQPLSISQEAVVRRGHAIECRINAEAPDEDFRPCPGKLTDWRPPQGDGIRVDSHCYPGYVVPPFYDSLLAKLVVHAGDRGSAVELMRGALDAFVVDGVQTTLPLLRRLFCHEAVESGRFDTTWLERVFMPKLGKEGS